MRANQSDTCRDLLSIMFVAFNVLALQLPQMVGALMGETLGSTTVGPDLLIAQL